MRIALAISVLLVMTAPALADEPSRAEAVVDALGVDARTAAKLLDVLTAHDLELAKLQRKRNEYKRQLVTAHHLDAKSVDRLLDGALLNQRALADADMQLIVRVRQLVPSPKAVQLLFLLSVTEPAQREAPAVTEARTRTAYDPDALFPPSSGNRPPCDPFASMHGCRY